MTTDHRAAVEGAVAAPTVFVLIWTQVAQMSLPQWAALVAVVSGVFHLAFLFWKWGNEWADRRRALKLQRKEHPELFETTDKAEL